MKFKSSNVFEKIYMFNAANMEIFKTKNMGLSVYDLHIIAVYNKHPFLRSIACL